MAKMSFDLFGALSPTDGEGESKVLDQNCANGKYHRSRTSGNRRGTEEEGRRQWRSLWSSRTGGLVYSWQCIHLWLNCMDLCLVSSICQFVCIDFPRCRQPFIAFLPNVLLTVLEFWDEVHRWNWKWWWCLHNWPQGSSGKRTISQIEVEGSTPQYEGTFDDYLEMFIQFGYVTLFRCKKTLWDK